MRTYTLVLSCEHGGNRVPDAYEPLFESEEAKLALQSHRGWDPGALRIARGLAEGLDAPLVYTEVTRLLIEPNKSLSHRRLFSEFSSGLSKKKQRKLVKAYYLPHRNRVEEAVREAIGATGCALHIGVHSFTPVHDGVVREADVGLLYDPAREREQRLCLRWQRLLKELDPELVVRRNYPYRGADDGLTTSLRAVFPPERYMGIELEINQALLLGAEATKRRVADVLGESLERLGERVG